MPSIFLYKKVEVPLVMIMIMLECRLASYDIFRSKNIFEPALEHNGSGECGESSFKLHSESNKCCSGDSLFVTF